MASPVFEDIGDIWLPMFCKWRWDADDHGVHPFNVLKI